MTEKRTALAWWFAGLVAFAIVLALHAPLAIEAVPGGIADHQRAGSAEQVDKIHAAWRAAGLYGQARIAMAGDLVFIGVFSLGTALVGRYLHRVGIGMVRTAGTAALIAAGVFCITDYTETIAQLIQLTGDKGSDTLAGLAASVRSVKMAAWVVSVIAVGVGIALGRNSRNAA